MTGVGSWEGIGATTSLTGEFDDEPVGSRVGVAWKLELRPSDLG